MTISRSGTPAAPTEAFATSVARDLGTVPTGALVNITLAGWNISSNPTIAAGWLTKTAGDATISTPTLDEVRSGNNGDGSFSWNAQWSFVVTNGGTLTVTAAGFPSAGGGSSLAISDARAITTLSWATDSSRVEDSNGQHTATDAATALSSGDATSVGEAWFVAGLTLNNGAAVTVGTPSGFAAVTDNGANGATVEVLGHADDIVTVGTTQAAAWTFSALDGASYNAQVATLVVYKEGPPAGPGITAVSDPNPRQGEALTLTVTAAGASQGSGSITLDGVAQTVTSWADTSITITVNRGASRYGVPVDLVLTTDDDEESAPFELTSVQPQADWAYVNIATPNADPALRLRSTPTDIASGDQIAYYAGVNHVTVANDATYSTRMDVREFDFEVWTAGEGWGDADTEVVLTFLPHVTKRHDGSSWVGRGPLLWLSSAWQRLRTWRLD